MDEFLEQAYELSTPNAEYEVGEDGFKVDSGPIIRHFATIDESFKAAQNEASTRMSRLLPAICYKQGIRRFLVTAMPWRAILKQVKYDSAEKGMNPEGKHNRPCDKSHYMGISKYVQDTPNYILPPITLCLEKRLNFYVGFSADAADNIPAMMGYLVLPDDEEFYAQDGQHRCRGLEDAIRLQKKYGGDSVAVSMAMEKNIDQIHQDFADCARTMPIAASLLAIYNTRDPLSMFVKAVTNKVPIFKNRIEKTTQTVGKKSPMIFTVNNLRQAIVVLVTGSRSNAGTVGETRPAVLKALAEDSKNKTFSLVTEFFDAFTQANQSWGMIAPVDPESENTILADKRPEYLSLSATGLLVMCEVGYNILSQYHNDKDERIRLIRHMAEMDWARSGALWQGNVVQNGSVVNQSREHLMGAGNNIRRELNRLISDPGKKLPLASKKAKADEAAA